MDLLTFIKKKRPQIKKQSTTITSTNTNTNTSTKQVMNKQTKSKHKINIAKRYDTQVHPIIQKSVAETPSYIDNNNNNLINNNQNKKSNQNNQNHQNNQSNSFEKKIISTTNNNNLNIGNQTNEYRNYQINNTIIKYKISAKQLLNVLEKLKILIQDQFDIALDDNNTYSSQKVKKLTGNITFNNNKKQQLEDYSSTDLYRIQYLNKSQILQRYQKILQGCQLFISKLKNNQSIKESIYVKNSQEFLLFFKSIFGKPYSFCNMQTNRKILQVLWENQLFMSNCNDINKKVQRCIENLRLWIHGISLPINPAAISLHKLVFQNPSLISKALKFAKNQHLYIHQNRGDSLGMTPFLLAVKSISKNSFQKQIAIEKLIKSGCDIFLCPLTFISNNKQKKLKQKKQNKCKIAIQYPIKQRKQTNAIQYLFSKKLYKNVADILFFDQLRYIKQFKNSRTLQQQLLEIPNCCFQIDWKTYKGMLSFKTLPKDIISIYKKDCFLRVDYHVDDIQNIGNSKKNKSPSQNQAYTQQHYSLLLKVDKNKPQFFLINHHQKKITDLLHEINPKIIQNRYQTLLHQGNIQNQQIVYLKSQFNEQTKVMQSSLTFAHQNIKNINQLSEGFKNIANAKEYQQTIINSQLIDYQQLQKSQTDSLKKQNFINLQASQLKGIKSKIIKNNCNFDIQWKKQKINFKHLQFMLRIIKRRSLFLIKIHKIFKLFLNQSILVQQKYHKMLPSKIKLNLENDLSIQAQIKNLSYPKLDNGVFSLDFKAIQNNFQYQSQNQQIASLHSTVVMDQMYSLNVSNFLGKQQRLMQIEDQQANQKFNELILQDMRFNSDDQQQKREQNPDFFQ